MSLNSYPFIFVFLPLALLIFYGLKNSSHSKRIPLALTLLSLFFYGWLSPRCLMLLIGSIGFNFGIRQSIKTLRVRFPDRLILLKSVLIFGIGTNLMLLGIFKYALFLIPLPLGISFLTFLQIAFLVDEYRGEGDQIESFNFLDYCVFVTFFPKIISGPIVRTREFIPQLKSAPKSDGAYNFSIGIVIFFIGLFKKVVVADNLAAFIDPAFEASLQGQALSFTGTWKAGIFYTFQLYFDFSGYSDMAIGLGKTFGIHLPLNFNSPYKAHNIADFWRRWHITLSDFLRDYIFIPLCVNSSSVIWMYASFLITMVLAGIWHGAGWTFVAWGTLHGIYICINYAWTSFLRSKGLHNPGGKLGLLTGRAITFISVVFGWIIFRAGDLDAAVRMIRVMLTINLSMITRTNLTWDQTNTTQLIWLLFLSAGVWLFPNTQQIMTLAFQNQNTAGNEASPKWWQWKPNFTWSCLAAGLILVVLINVSNLTPFMYFRF